MDAWDAECHLEVCPKCCVRVGCELSERRCAQVSSGDVRAWLKVSPDERKEAHSPDFSTERQSLPCMRTAELFARRHPPAMRGLSGGRRSGRETESGTKARSQHSQTIHMDQKEVPEMPKETARATENMRLRSRLFLNSHRIRRAEDGSFLPRLEASDYRCLLAASDVILDTIHDGGVTHPGA